MKQEKKFDFTKKIIASSLDYTNSIMEKSKNHCKPSPNTIKIGAKIGICVGIAILIGGMVQIMMNKPIYAVVSFLAAGSTIFFNTIYLKKRND